MTYINFAILNSHVKVIYLRFTKSTNFYVVKEKNLAVKKMAVFPLLFILVCKMCLFSSAKMFKTTSVRILHSKIY